MFVESAQNLVTEYEGSEWGGFPHSDRHRYFAVACSANSISIEAIPPIPSGINGSLRAAMARAKAASLRSGSYVNTIYRPEKADVILSLDSDFLASGPGHIRYMREFYRRRKLSKPRRCDEPSLCR